MTDSAPAPLTLQQASELVGDDIAYWLKNPFMSPDLLAEKVCWWLDRAVVAARADERERMLTPWYVLRRVAQTMPHNPEAAEWIRLQADGWEASGIVAAPVETNLTGDSRRDSSPDASTQLADAEAADQ